MTLNVRINKEEEKMITKMIENIEEKTTKLLGYKCKKWTKSEFIRHLIRTNYNKLYDEERRKNNIARLDK